MPDGVKLWTTVWDAHIRRGDRVPVVFVRSPYGDLATQNIADLFIPFGFAAISQNQRGTGKSGGNWTYWVDAASDGSATMDWVAKQPFSNGQVFQAGASADGILSTLDMLKPEPHLHGEWLMVTTSLPYKTMFQNSEALRHHLTHSWLRLIQLWRPNLPSDTYYDFVLSMEGFNAQHGGLRWPEITLTNLTTVDFPAVFWGGWYDIFLQPMLETFHNYDTKSVGAGRGTQQMFIDPRGHCFVETEVSFPNDRLIVAWSYDQAIKLFKSRWKDDPNPLDDDDHDEMVSSRYKKYTMYVMGPEKRYQKEKEVAGMFYTTLDSFPVPNPLVLYLSQDARLSVTPPKSQRLTYTYDPANPIPTRGGNNLFLACGPQNQLDIESRSDQLIFTSLPFTEHTAVVGRISVVLTVASTAVDTDFVARVSDVYPDDAHSLLIGDQIVRMRWRDGPDKLAPKMTPEGQYEITVNLWMTAFVFNKGHRLRLAIASANSDRYNANNNNGFLVAQGGPKIIANNTVILGNSKIVLPVVPMSSLPKLSIL